MPKGNLMKEFYKNVPQEERKWTQKSFKRQKEKVSKDTDKYTNW